MDGTDSGVTVAAPQARHDGPPNDQVHNLSRLAKKKKEDAHCFVGMKVVASDVMAHEFTRKKDVGEIEVEVARR